MLGDSLVTTWDTEPYEGEDLKEVLITIGFRQATGDDVAEAEAKAKAEEDFRERGRYLKPASLFRPCVTPTDAPICLDFVAQIISYCRQKHSFYTRSTRFAQHSLYGMPRIQASKFPRILLLCGI